MNYLQIPLLMVPLLTQQPAGQQQPEPQQQSRSTAELVMLQYRPKNVGARELYDVAQRMLGHVMQLQHAVTGDWVQLENLQRLGDAILLYDFPESAQAGLKMLAELDAGYSGQGTTPTYVTREYAARFVSLDSLAEALASFRIPTRRDDAFDLAHQLPNYESRQPAQNLSFIEERNVVVLHDTPEKVAEMLDVLGRIDVAAPQALVTCYLVAASEEPGEDWLPPELVQGLRQLIGAPNIERHAMGMLRTSTSTQRQLSILLESRQRGAFDFVFAPAAYDEKQRSLTLADCTLIMGGKPLFRTSTAVTSGEYTVIGATGSTPMFVVLHFQPVTP